MKTIPDVPFKEVKGHPLFLDFYLPEAENPPLIFWIHGGGWEELSRKWCLVLSLVERGYAVASPDYRYSDEAPFPAQMLDLKDALRFVKEHAGEYGYDATRIVTAGDSAGGHLACMMGVSIGNPDWMTETFDDSVQGVLDFSGAAWISGQTKDEDNFTLRKLLGVPLNTKGATVRAMAATPIHYIDGSEPPFLILHGSEDPVVSPLSARKLRNALEEAGVPVHLYLVPGGLHGLAGKLVDDIICEFLDYYLYRKKTVITPVVEDCHQRTVPEQPLNF